MSQSTRAALKALFANFKYPTGSNFDDLIDSFLNLLDDAIPGAGGLSKKALEIGDWNMTTTGNVQVPHGLVITNIRSISVILFTDSASGIFPLNYMLSGAAPSAGGAAANSTNINLSRTAGGYFDGNTDFNNTPFNRGWIVIDYVE